MKIYTILVALVIPFLGFSQDYRELTGKVLSLDNPAISVNVLIENTSKGTLTDFDGHFRISNISENKFTLIIKALGYKTKKMAIDFGAKKSLFLSIDLEASNEVLNEVIVEGLNKSEKIIKKGFAVNTLKTETYKNVSTDINAIIDNIPGVILRVNGGVGSSFDLAVNGLSGNHIKSFFDDISMENWGSALSLNNLPVNLIDRVSVYKGVVPVRIGADALGGAINIFSAPLDIKKLDITYTIGSFNTQSVGFTGQTYTKRNIFFRLSAFLNTSDNDYWVNNVPATDEFGNINGITRARRFHDSYYSSMVSGKLGVINKKYADELTLNYTYAENKNDIQHPAISINEVYGALHSKNKTHIGHIKYKKQLDKLTIASHLLIGKIRETIVDTVARNYNFFGDFVPRSDASGEFYDLKSIYNLTDNISSSSTTVDYRFDEHNETTLNFSTNSLNRKGDDELNLNNVAFRNPNKVNKNIIGLSHQLKDVVDDLRVIGFAKYYGFEAEIRQVGFDEDQFALIEQNQTSRLNSLGYGITTSYDFSKNLLGKFSYENAFRLPEADEILGDGFLTASNKDLQEERSNNFNLEFQYFNRRTPLNIRYETNLFYRESQNFIRVQTQGPLSINVNEDNVRILGIENSVQLKFNNKYNFSATVTYQSLTDRTEFDEGLDNVNFKSRIPNIPYFFGNLRAGINFLSEKENQDLQLWFTSRYTHKFFLTFESLGDVDEKNIIPTQFINDIDITYSFDRKYNISASLRNIFNTDNFDNFNIQKPGRGLYVKLRYSL